MTKIPLRIGVQTGATPSRSVSVERLINGYLEQTPEGKEQGPVYGIPGLSLFKAVDEDPAQGYIRALFRSADHVFVVHGTSVFQMAEDKVLTLRGTVDEGLAVDVAGDGVNVVMVVPETGEIYIDNGTSTAAVTDPDAPVAGSVAWVDGYFVFTEKDTDRWFISALGDPSAYDALDYASAEWKPDKLVRAVTLKNDLLLVGESTMEMWRNTGAVDFPFERLEGGLIGAGLIGAFAMTETNDALYWIAQDLTVRRLDGVIPKRISTFAIAKTIKAWSDPSLTVASAHVFGDHLFIVFHNPDGCVVFDQATERWHERRSWGLDTWRARVSEEAWGQVLYGDYQSGKIYTVDGDAVDEDGEIIALEMIFPHLWTKGDRFTVNSIELIFEAGTTDDLTANPKLMFDYSTDGDIFKGLRTREMGKTGDRSRRAVITSLGQHREMVPRVRVTDACRRVFLAAYADIELDE